MEQGTVALLQEEVREGLLDNAELGQSPEGK